jgi:hypothetical protein
MFSIRWLKWLLHNSALNKSDELKDILGSVTLQGQDYV